MGAWVSGVGVRPLSGPGGISPGLARGLFRFRGPWRGGARDQIAREETGWDQVRSLFVGVQPLSVGYPDIFVRAASASSRYWLPHFASRRATQMRSSSPVPASLRIVLSAFIPACVSAVCN